MAVKKKWTSQCKMSGHSELSQVSRAFLILSRRRRRRGVKYLTFRGNVKKLPVHSAGGRSHSCKNNPWLNLKNNFIAVFFGEKLIDCLFGSFQPYCLWSVNHERWCVCVIVCHPTLGFKTSPIRSFIWTWYDTKIRSLKCCITATLSNQLSAASTMTTNKETDI